MAITTSQPGAPSTTAALPSGPNRARDAVAQSTMSRASPQSSHAPCRTTARARSSPSRRLDAAAKTDATNRPTGVASVNPGLGVASNTPGVASACRARKPAAARNASDTRSSRASLRSRAAVPVA